MFTDDHHKFMQAALQEAINAGQKDEVPIGAVLVKDGQIIARSGNKVETDQNPTAHAEIVVIQMASKAMNNKRLPNCDLYVSLEPCTMCAGAIAMARIQTVFFAADDPKGGGILHGAKFFNQPTCHHRLTIHHMDEYANQSATLLKDFFQKKRQKD